jgi:hypothetical protein
VTSCGVSPNAQRSSQPRAADPAQKSSIGTGCRAPPCLHGS